MKYRRKLNRASLGRGTSGSEEECDGGDCGRERKRGKVNKDGAGVEN